MRSNVIFTNLNILAHHEKFSLTHIRPVNQQTHSLQFVDNFIETTGDFVTSIDNLQFSFIGNSANVTNALTLILLPIICTEGDSTKLTGDTIIANNYVFSDSEMKQLTTYYVYLSGPNNVTVSGNIFSIHLICTEFGSSVTINRQEFCLPQDGINQNYIYNSNVLTKHPHAKDD